VYTPNAQLKFRRAPFITMGTGLFTKTQTKGP